LRSGRSSAPDRPSSGSQQDRYYYRKLVDELSAVQRETTAELQQTNAALSHLRAQIEELGQSVSEVDRALKAVE
jgi:prefoldin subunit 5